MLPRPKFITASFGSYWLPIFQLLGGNLHNCKAFLGIGFETSKNILSNAKKSRTANFNLAWLQSTRVRALLLVRALLHGLLYGNLRGLHAMDDKFDMPHRYGYQLNIQV